MDKLTKREALEIVVKMWDELAATGSKNKGKLAFRLGYTLLDCHCGACEYDKQHGGGTCTKCPIWEKNGNTPAPCSDDLESYGGWNRSKSTYDRKRYAKAVAVLARRRLAELDKEEAPDE